MGLLVAIVVVVLAVAGVALYLRPAAPPSTISEELISIARKVTPVPIQRRVSPPVSRGLTSGDVVPAHTTRGMLCIFHPDDLEHLWERPASYLKGEGCRDEFAAERLALWATDSSGDFDVAVAVDPGRVAPFDEVCEFALQVHRDRAWVGGVESIPNDRKDRLKPLDEKKGSWVRIPSGRYRVRVGVRYTPGREPNTWRHRYDVIFESVEDDVVVEAPSEIPVIAVWPDDNATATPTSPPQRVEVLRFDAPLLVIDAPPMAPGCSIRVAQAPELEVGPGFERRIVLTHHAAATLGVMGVVTPRPGGCEAAIELVDLVEIGDLRVQGPITVVAARRLKWDSDLATYDQLFCDLRSTARGWLRGRIPVLTGEVRTEAVAFERSLDSMPPGRVVGGLAVFVGNALPIDTRLSLMEGRSARKWASALHEVLSGKRMGATCTEPTVG